jgi:hypothetical protein
VTTVASVHRRTAVVSAVAAGGLAVAAILIIMVTGAGDSDTDPMPAAPTDVRSAAGEPTASPPTTDPRWLLPDMRSLGARDLQIVGSADDRQLRFAAWLGNDGPGPLLVVPRPGPGCPPEQRAAEQILHFDTAGDGVYQRRDDPPRRQRPVGCMVDHPTHDHWHFDAMAGYALVTVDGSRSLAARDKVSFCLRDNSRVPGASATHTRAYFGECERDTEQGISPGWVDVYDSDTPGQSLRLPAGMPDSVYCLTLEADPRDLLLEADETDNATAIAVRITGRSVRPASGPACRDAA